MFKIYSNSISKNRRKGTKYIEIDKKNILMISVTGFYLLILSNTDVNKGSRIPASFFCI
jgi:hypothetical protein